MTRPIPGRDRPPPGSPPLRLCASASTTAAPHPPVLRPASPPAGGPPTPPAPVVLPPTAVPATADQQATTLWAAYRRAPGPATCERLVLHYHPLVRAVVGRTVGRLPGHVERADLVQSGVFGLLEAIERYDPSRCPHFESYAVPRIRGAVLDELRAQDWVPRTVRLRAREAARTREHLSGRLRRTATEREVADALQVGLPELRAASGAQLLSIERLRESADGRVAELAADAAADPAVTAQDRELRRQLWLAVAQLGERDRLVVRLYYLESRTLAEIGRLLGVTESRISQLHSRLVGRLRGALEERAAG
jgi:RNA polymerase sigma factor FliA